MYRAIICVSMGKLKGPNPIFRTPGACSTYWYSRMCEAGPAIESFKVVRTGKQWDGDREKLHDDFIRLRHRVKPFEDDELVKMMEILAQIKDDDVDLAMAAMMDELWKEKERIDRGIASLLSMQLRPLTPREVWEIKERD